MRLQSTMKSGGGYYTDIVCPRCIASRENKPVLRQYMVAHGVQSPQGLCPSVEPPAHCSVVQGWLGSHSVFPSVAWYPLGCHKQKNRTPVGYHDGAAMIP